MSLDPLARALELAALAASEGEVPVGAVIIRDGQLVSEGRNRREGAKDPLGHAELCAIAAAAKKLDSWRLHECTLYVTLEPCPMCLAAAQQARIGAIIYGAADPKGGALSLGYRVHEDPRTNHRFEVRLEARPECGEILTRFFERRRTETGSSGKKN